MLRLRHLRVSMVEQTEPQTAEDVSTESGQDRRCTACEVGQVQEVGQEVRVSVIPRQPHEESRISSDGGKRLTFP